MRKNIYTHVVHFAALLIAVLLFSSEIFSSTVTSRLSGTVNWSRPSVWIMNRTGTVTFTNASTSVTGSGTLFTTELAPGDTLVLQGTPATQRGVVSTITNDSVLTLVANAAASVSGAYGKYAIPTSNDDVYVGNSLVAGNLTVTLDLASVTISSLTIQNTAQNIVSHTSGDSLIVTHDVTVVQPTSAVTTSWNVSNGYGVVSGNLTVGGTNTNASRVARVLVTNGTLSVAGTASVSSNSVAANQLFQVNGTGSMTFANLVNLSSGTINSSASGGTFNFSNGFSFGGSNNPALSTVNGSVLNITGNLTTTTTTMSMTAGSTVAFSGTGTITPNSAIIFSNVTFNSGASDSLAGNISVGRNWTNNGGTLRGGSNTVTFGGSGFNITGTSGTSFPNLVIDVGATYTLGSTGNTCSSLTFTQTSGAASSLTHSSTNSLNVNGDVIINQPANAFTTAWNINGGSSTVTGNITLGGSNATSSVIAKIAVTSGSLTVNGSVNLASNTVAANEAITLSTGSITIASAFTLSSGTITMSGAGTFNFNGGLTFGGANSPSFTTVASSNINIKNAFTLNTTSLTFNGTSNTGITASTTVTPNAAITFGNLTINASDTLTLAGDITVAGSLTNNGTLSGGSNTVTLSGSGKNITGVTTFPNLAIASGATYTLNNNITLNNLTFNAASVASSITHSSTVSATVNGNVTINQPTANVTTGWNINAGSATVAGTLTHGGTDAAANRIATIVVTTGSLSVTGAVSYQSNATAANQVISVTSGTLTFSSLLNLNNGTLSNLTTAGTINFNGGFSFGSANTPVFNTLASTNLNFNGDVTTTTTNLTLNGTSNSTFATSGSITPNSTTLTFGNITINNGITTTLAGNITVSGNWTNNGTLNGGSNTVTLSGAGKNLTGVTRFPTLAIATAATYTLGANDTCSYLVFNAAATASSLTHSGSNSLTVLNDVTVNQPTAGVTSSWNINAGSATVAGALAIGSTDATANRIAQIAVTTGSLSVTGTVTYGNNTRAANEVISVTSGTLTFSSLLTLSSGTLSNGTSAGTFNFTNGLAFGGANTPVFTTLAATNLNFTGDLSATTTTLTFNATSNANINQSVNVTSNANLSFGHLTILNGKTATFPTAGGTLTIAGNLLFSGSSTIAGTQPFTLSTAATTIGGNGTISNTGTMTVSNSRTILSSATLSLSGTVAINGSLTITNKGNVTTTAAGGITGTAAGSTWLNDTSATLSVTGPILSTGTLTATAPSNTINYSGAVQTIKTPSSNTYYHLILSGTGTKTAASNDTVTGNFTINGASSFTGGAFIHTFRGNWIVNTSDLNPFVSTGTTTTFGTPTPAVATSISGTTTSLPLTFNIVNINNTAGVSTSLDISASGNFTIASGVTFTPGAANVVSGSGTLTGNGIAQTTRIISSAEFNSQYTITNRTLSNLTVEYNGTSPQTISPLTYGSLKINNSTGVTTLGGNTTVSGVLTLVSGTIATGTNKVIISSTGSVSRTTGYIVGNLQKYAATGATSLSYEIGDATGYSPLSVSFGNVSVAGNLIASATGTDHPNISTSGLNNLRSVNRYWTLTNSGVTFNNYSATFNFVSSDLDSNADFNTFDVAKYASSAWSIQTLGSRAATSTSATGITTFGDFAIGKQVTSYTLTPSAGANGSISPSTPVNINEGLSQLFTITPDAHYHIDSVKVDGAYVGNTSYTIANVIASHSISASFAIDTHTLTVNATNGTVAKNPDQVSYNYGTNVDLTPTPSTGYHFVNWTGDASGSANPLTVSVTANKTITGNFAINTYTLDVTQGAHGTITPNDTTVDYGSNQTFTITPSTGYHIDSVFADGAYVGAVATYDFTTITANHTISASFAINTYSITVTQTTHGTITPGTQTVNYGSNTTFTMTPDASYHVDSVFADGAYVGSDTSYTFSSVTANHTITAKYLINSYTLTVNATHGTVTKNPDQVTYTHGTNVDLTPNPAVGYHFVNWSGDASGSANPLSVSMIANKTITSNFSIDVFTITASAGSHGSISPSGVVNVNYGSDTTFTMTPSTGYHVDSIYADGSYVGSGTSYGFTNVTANHTVSVVFAINTYTITVTQASNGTIAPGTTITNYFTSPSFSITPATGYRVDSVFVDGVYAGTITNYVFTNVSTNHTLSATYALNTFTITVVQGAYGTVAPGTTTVNYNDDQPFTMTPATGYHVDSVFIDGIFAGALTSYNFTNITANHTLSAKYAINVYTLTVTQGSNGTIAPGTTSVTHAGSQPFTITPNTGYHIDSVSVDGANLGVITSYNFTNVTANHTITAKYGINTFTITVTQADSGTITPGTSVVGYGTTPTFTMTPVTGYHVDSVFVDAAYVGSMSTYNFDSVKANHSLRATYVINTYTVTVTQGAHGTIAPGTTTANYGTNLPFTLTPATGYHVDSVFVDGFSAGAVTNYLFTSVNANHTLSAKYAINTYVITVTAGAHGTVTPGTTTVKYDSSLSFTIAAATGYHIDSVFADGISEGAVSSFDFNNVTDDHTLVTKYAINKYTLTVGATHGTVDKNPDQVTYDHGTSVTLTPNPAVGYHFVNWSGDINSTSNPLTFSMLADKNITGNFAINTYTITLSPGAHGTIPPGGSVVVNYGSDVAFSIIPSAKYHVDTVFVDGVRVDSLTNYTFINVTANHTLSSKFAINTYQITTSAGVNGTISPSGPVTVNEGDSVVFSVLGNSGFHTDSLFVDAVLQSTANSYTFRNVTANHSIAAVYAVTPPADTIMYRTFKVSTELYQKDNKPVKMKFNAKTGVLTSSAPNVGTVAEYVFSKIGKTGTTFLGVPQTDNALAKKFGWIFYKKAADLGGFFGSIASNGYYPIDYLPGKRPENVAKPSKAVKAIKADSKKYTNVAWQQGVIFKLNIIASQVGVMPTGFGSLVLDTTYSFFGRTLRGKTLTHIDSLLDSVMTYWSALGDTSLTQYNETANFITNIIQPINERFYQSFIGTDTNNMVIDTNGVKVLKNGYALKALKGVKTATQAGLVKYVFTKEAPQQFVAQTGYLDAPENFELGQNYPNPFNPTTTISFALPKASAVTVKVYNTLGQEVATLLNEVSMNAGDQEVQFDASNLPSGVYFYRVSVDGGVSEGIKKMILMK